MRINTATLRPAMPRPVDVRRMQPRPQPVALDRFEGATSTARAAATAAPQPVAQPSAMEQTVAQLVERALSALVQKLASWLGRITQPKQPALPAPAAPTAPAAPVSPAAPAPAGALAPTPLRTDDPPGVVGYCNTPQNKNIAPRSRFANAVNAAIDRVRAKGIGMDLTDPERNTIESFNTYHNAVVQDLLRQGYNCNYDGEELSINRPGDAHSENFDISTWKGEVRRFYASWQSPPVFAA